MISRRVFLGTVAGGLLAAPLAAEAQQARRAVRIGFLSSSLSPAGLEPFRQGLGERGYLENRNVAIEARFASLDLDRLPGLAAELVQLHVDISLAI